MAKKNERDDVEPQSQSQAGPTGENPNEDKANGTQSTAGQPGVGEVPAPGTTGGTSVPSDGGNPAANTDGANGPAGQ